MSRYTGVAGQHFPREQKVRFAMTGLDLIQELNSTECRCGSVKTSGHTFCYDCWQKLPDRIRKQLYKPLGRGYEEAYLAACRTYLNLPIESITLGNGHVLGAAMEKEIPAK